MLKDLKEMEQIYCLEIPKGIRVKIWYENFSTITNNARSLTIKRAANFYNILLGDIECLFDRETLFNQLESFGLEYIEIHGIINGPNLTFSVTDVTLNKDCISVPLASEMSKFLKFQFVPYSIVAPREVEFSTGVILRPIQECIDEDGNRIIEEIK